MLPQRIALPHPSWTREVDVVVLGSGAAGLSAALAARPVRDVLIITKDTLDAGSTAWAQGGLAAVLDPRDSIEEHVQDTLTAGAGLCDEANVRMLVTEAPTAIRYLQRLGAAFDRSENELALTREGGHSQRRIVHAGGDRSGAEVQRTLDESVRAAGVDVLERAVAVDLVIGVDAGGNSAVMGVDVVVCDERGAVLSVGRIFAPAVIVATGGFGQVFASTSNPPAVTGDGLAMALRAGAIARDLEFVQFHPTVLWAGSEAKGQLALISEAVRGEGALLYDAAGQRVMEGVHPLEDLAPRDVVAAAISSRMTSSPNGVGTHVYLDARMISNFAERFPAIFESCMNHGIDPRTEMIPVAPAAHYVCGGVDADLDGRTNINGLFAVGEVACTGVHGANRLASNSLTEGVVAGTRVGRTLAWDLPRTDHLSPVSFPQGYVFGIDSDARTATRATMSRDLGVMRDPARMKSAITELESLASPGTEPLSRQTIEAANLLTIATAVSKAAMERTESRGCHRRTDYAGPIAAWERHIDVRLHDGAIRIDDHA